MMMKTIFCLFVLLPAALTLRVAPPSDVIVDARKGDGPKTPFDSTTDLAHLMLHGAALQFNPSTFNQAGGVSNEVSTPEKIVHFALPSRKVSADGGTVRDCFDLDIGLHLHAEEYGAGHFQYRCNNGVSECIGCIIKPKSTVLAVVPFGETANVTGYWHKCDHFKNNHTVRYSQETRCLSPDGKELSIGEILFSGPFKLRCDAKKRFAVDACLYLDHKKMQWKIVNISQTATVGIVRHHCEADINGEGRVKYFISALGCEQGGKEFKEGDQWTRNHLRYRCGPKGYMEIIGCISDSGISMYVGEDVIEKRTVHRCYKDELTTYYNEYACGLPGVPKCAVERIIPGSLISPELADTLFPARENR